MYIEIFVQNVNILLCHIHWSTSKSLLTYWIHIWFPTTQSFWSRSLYLLLYCNSVSWLVR